MNFKLNCFIFGKTLSCINNTESFRCPTEGHQENSWAYLNKQTGICTLNLRLNDKQFSINNSDNNGYTIIINPSNMEILLRLPFPISPPKTIEQFKSKIKTLLFFQ